MKPSELNLDIDAARTDLLDFDIRGAAELSLSQPLVQIYVQRMLVGVLVEEVGLGGLLGVEALPDELDELSITALAAVATSPVKSSHVESAASMRLRTAVTTTSGSGSAAACRSARSAARAARSAGSAPATPLDPLSSPISLPGWPPRPDSQCSMR